jgi:hypothetical protein
MGSSPPPLSVHAVTLSATFSIVCESHQSRGQGIPRKSSKSSAVVRLCGCTADVQGSARPAQQRAARTACATHGRVLGTESHGVHSSSGRRKHRASRLRGCCGKPGSGDYPEVPALRRPTQRRHPGAIAKPTKSGPDGKVLLHLHAPGPCRNLHPNLLGPTQCGGLHGKASPPLLSRFRSEISSALPEMPSWVPRRVNRRPAIPFGGGSVRPARPKK